MIPMNLKVLFLNSFLRSVLLYAVEAMVLTKAQLQTLESAYVSLLRRLIPRGFRKIEGTYRFELDSTQVHNITRTPTIQAFLRRRQSHFIAHQVRRENTHFIKRLLFNCSPQTRKGKPAQSMIEYVSKQCDTSRDLFLQGCIKKTILVHEY